MECIMYIYLYTRVTCASITSVALQHPCPDPSAIPAASDARHSHRDTAGHQG
jgi:hypothetical protein